jgi:uncharacterized protein DUF5615
VKLKLFLDEHIDPAVAAALRRRFPGLEVLSIHDTAFVGLADPALLEILDTDKRTLVTRDVNSVPLHANRRIEAGLTHGGVIYVDSKRLKQKDRRGLIRRLAAVVDEHGHEDWTCRSGWL